MPMKNSNLSKYLGSDWTGITPEGLEEDRRSDKRVYKILHTPVF